MTRWSLAVCALALMSAAAFGQTPTPSKTPTDGTSSLLRVRAPAAKPGDIEPAVDVGGGRGPAPAPVAKPPPEPTAAVAPPSVGPHARAQQAAPPAGNSRVMDTLDLGTTSITGNQELPKVLYIVPWKRSDLGDLVGRPVNTLLDEVLEPVDPEVFERHLKYYESLYGDGAKE
jgi:hypothetical protein